MSELKEAQQLNVQKEMQSLLAQHYKVTLARKRLRTADADLANAWEDHFAPSGEVGRLTKERNMLREGVKDERLKRLLKALKALRLLDFRAWKEHRHGFCVTNGWKQ